MGVIKFAALVSLISHMTDYLFDEFQLKQLYEIASTTGFDAGKVKLLMTSMATNQKIEAIKAYRDITHEGLKESKDAVEAVMDKFAKTPC